MRIALALGVLGLGCVQEIDRVPAASDAASDAGNDAPALVTVSGTIRNLSEATVEGALVSTIEFPAITAVSNALGRYELSLPTEVEVTVAIDAPSSVRTVSQTVVLHAPTSVDFLTATNAQFFNIIQAAGEAPRGTGAIYASLAGDASCTDVGSTVSVTPESGKVIYARSDLLPGPELVSMVDKGPAFYVTGITASSVTVSITPPSPCKQPAWPVRTAAYDVLGPVKVFPDTLNGMTVLIGK
jgi:hypothetical protein